MPSPLPNDRRPALPFAAAVALALVAATVGPAAAAPAQRTTVMVQVAPGTDAAALARQAAGSTGRVDHVYEHAVDGFTATLPAQAVEALRRNPRVVSVEPDRVAQLFDTQSPTPSWGLDRIDQERRRLSRSYTWTADGRGVDAYVLDSGIRADHTDLGGRVRQGFTAITDGRGTSDCNGHGTHVAGILGGTRHGVAKAVTLIPVRVLSCDGSSTYSRIIAGLDYTAEDHLDGVPAVANLSLGGPTSAMLDAAVAALVEDGVTVVVAAGNSGSDACRVSPARVGPVLTVGATTAKDSRAYYSNFGACLDLFAPGSSITSTWPTTTTSTATLSGTSMAAPHVTGAAALLLSQQPTLTPADVAAALVGTATAGVVTKAGSQSPNRLLRAPG